MADQTPEITWLDERTPVSKQYGDPYYSVQDGLAEARHVFLDGNDLPARFRPDFHIAELGFGTGLNLLATLQCFRKSACSGYLYFTSFEAAPLSAKTMLRALSGFAELKPLATELLDHWPPQCGHVELSDLKFNLVSGDARVSLKTYDKPADAWFLDGFSPAKNPELWGADILAQDAHLTNPSGTFATYTAAGHVRRGLTDAGFDVTRRPGFGRKRHMTTGQLGSAK